MMGIREQIANASTHAELRVLKTRMDSAYHRAVDDIGSAFRSNDLLAANQLTICLSYVTSALDEINKRL